jgi:glycosyltransferase involved in cell wall biosynthesis
MKIAIWHNLPSGGGKRALSDQVRGLVARGHHVQSWCPSTADQTYLPLSDLIQERILPLSGAMWDARGWVPRTASAQIAAMEDHCRACAEQIMAGDFDLLFAHDCQFSAVGPIGRFVPLKKVLYLAQPNRRLYEAAPRLPWLPLDSSSHSFPGRRWLRDRAKERWTLYNARRQGVEELRNARSFDFILVNSLFSRESLLRCYDIAGEVCYLGVDGERFVHRGQDREPFVIGLGSYTKAKNIRFVIESIALLPPPRPRLMWIGNSTIAGYLEEMTALASSLDVPFSPHLRISDEAIVELLNKATMLVYAPRLEPFGYAPLEAAACGLPVVAVAEGGIRETVIDGETGLLVPSSHEAVADAVARLLTDQELVRRMGNSARANMERRWSVEGATERLEQALLRATSPSAIPALARSRPGR